MTPWKKHVNEWSECVRCPLCNTRSTVVLARGHIPCDVLMIGEAPGASEDVLGEPFVGPAGKLLDRMIEAAVDTDNRPRIALSNLLACIPKDAEGNKIVNGSDIPEEYIQACRPRIRELMSLCSPTAIVLVGRLAAMHTPADTSKVKLVVIDHPAYILRLDVSQKPLAIQRNVVELRDLFEDVMGA